MNTEDQAAEPLDSNNPSDSFPTFAALERLQYTLSATRTIGWIILMSAIGKSMMLIVPFILMIISVRAGLTLGLLTLPVWLIVLTGSVGLIRNKRWGFHFIYVATAISLFMGAVPYVTGISLFPLIERWIRFGPFNSQVLQALNLVIVAGLAWCHHRIRRSLGAPPLAWQTKATLIGTIAILLAGSVWWNWMHYQRGRIESLDQVEALRGKLHGLANEGPVEIKMVHFARMNAVMGTTSGKATEEAIKAFVNAHGLQELTLDKAMQKAAPIAKSWKLPEEQFAQNYEAGSRAWIGRLPGHPKLVVMVWWRSADRKFTVELMGLVGAKLFQAATRESP